MKIHLPPFVVDTDARAVHGGGREDALTDIEARLLEWLARRDGAVVAKDQLLAEVWGYDPRVRSRTVDTTVFRIRAKIEPDPALPRYLLTVAGSGLRLVVPGPSGVTTFGRERERVAALAGLEAGRLVTLTGPGGAGKTHLARAIGIRQAGTFHGLEACHTEGDFVRAVGMALSPGWDPRPADAAALVERVRAEGRCLLVFDNLEQGIGPAAALIRVLLDGAPEATILATSREPLGLAGEVVVGVGGLDRDAAARLFAARAGRPMDESWHVPDAVDQVLGAVDRLPLAIELVAGWADSLPLGELAARLNDGIELLVSERRDIPERHRSLGVLVADSIQLLESDARGALAQLAVVAGEFSAADAEAIVLPGPVLVLVRALLRRSLLHSVAPGRYRLYEVVRTHLRSTPLPAGVALRLARHLARLGDAEALLRPSEVRAASVSDLRTAIHAALEAGEGDVAARCVRALAAVPGVDVRVALDLLDAVARQGSPGLAGRLAFDRARLLWAAGDLPGARAAVATLLSRLPADPTARVGALQLAAVVARESGDPEGAMHHLQRALAVDSIGAALRGSVLGDLGTVLARRGQTVPAEEALREALVLLEGEVDTGARAAAMVNLAAIFRETGRDPLPLLAEALALHRAGGRRRSEGIVLGALGIALLDGGDPVAARAHFAEAVDVLGRIGASNVAAVFRANLAYVDRDAGRTAEAWDGYQTALRTLREVGDTSYEGLALGNLGEMAVEAGRDREGLAMLDEALRLATVARFSKLEGVFLGSAGLVRVRLGEGEAGVQQLARGEEILRAGEYRDELCRLLARRALAAVLLGDLVGADGWLREAQGLLRPVPWVERVVREAERAVAEARRSRSPADAGMAARGLSGP